MQKEPIQLHIPKPCQQSWDSMQTTNAGQFCASCQQNVVDFTAMSDNELLYFFSDKKNAKTCGRFRSDQLHRSMELPFIQPRFTWRNRLFAIFFGALLNLQSVAAQDNTSVGLSMVEGKVIDESQEELIGVHLVLMVDDALIYETKTGLDGGFKLNFDPSHLTKDNNVLIEYLGYASENFTLNQIRSQPTIKLKENSFLSGEVVVLKTPLRLNWVKRIGRSVKEFFQKHRLTKEKESIDNIPDLNIPNKKRISH